MSDSEQKLPVIQNMLEIAGTPTSTKDWDYYDWLLENDPNMGYGKR
jgi:hypothetical protein